MVLGGTGFLDFEDSLGASNIGFVKCKKTIGFCRPGLLHVDHSLRKSKTFLKRNQKLKEFSRFSMVFGRTWDLKQTKV